MAVYKTIYQCRECGSTSYQRVFERGANGVLAATGQYRCTGCRNVFANVRDWWEPRPVPDKVSDQFPVIASFLRPDKS